MLIGWNIFKTSKNKSSCLNVTLLTLRWPGPLRTFTCYLRTRGSRLEVSVTQRCRSALFRHWLHIKRCHRDTLSCGGQALMTRRDRVVMLGWRQPKNSVFFQHSVMLVFSLVTFPPWHWLRHSQRSSKVCCKQNYRTQMLPLHWLLFNLPYLPFFNNSLGFISVHLYFIHSGEVFNRASNLTTHNVYTFKSCQDVRLTNVCFPWIVPHNLGDFGRWVIGLNIWWGDNNDAAEKRQWYFAPGFLLHLWLLSANHVILSRKSQWRLGIGRRRKQKDWVQSLPDGISPEVPSYCWPSSTGSLLRGRGHWCSLVPELPAERRHHVFHFADI